MNHMIQRLEPENLLEKITTEALCVLSLCGPAGIGAIVPLEASLPLVAKAWEAPEGLLDAQTERFTLGKQLAADGKSGLPELDFSENYDGDTIARLLRSLFETAVRLEEQTERKTVYDAAVFLAEALDFQEFLTPAGKNMVKHLWGMFRNAVRKDNPQKRMTICGKALERMDHLYTHGINRIVWGMTGPAW